MRAIGMILLPLCAAHVAAQEPPAAAVGEAPVTLRWVGCGIAKKAFMAALADGYREKTSVEIALEGGGATRGIRDVAAGLADLGGTCRHKLDRDDEAAAVLHPIGWDAVVAVVHPDNPIERITFAGLKKVMTGKVHNWRELGGPDARIELCVRAGSTSGVGLMARELLFWDRDVEFGEATTFPSSGPLEAAIEGRRFAIGLTGVSSARKRKLKLLQVNGVAPTVENIVDGSYPVVRPLYLVTGEQPAAEVQAFVAWALGEGQALVRREGTVTVAQGQRLWLRYSKLMKVVRSRRERRERHLRGGAARPPR